MTAILGYAAPGSRLEITGPAGPGRQFRVDLVRGDNGKSVCQSIGTDYGEAIMAAESLASVALSVVDRVGESV